MYCKNCGKQLDDNAVACMGCGADPRKKGKFCGNCGASVHENAAICVTCGHSLVPMKNSGGSNNDPSINGANEGQGMAIASLVLSILGLGSCWDVVTGIIFGVIGMILGGIAKKNKKLTMAKAGFVIGLIAIILSVIALIIWIIYWILVANEVNDIYKKASKYYYY